MESLKILMNSSDKGAVEDAVELLKAKIDFRNEETAKMRLEFEDVKRFVKSEIKRLESENNAFQKKMAVLESRIHLQEERSVNSIDSSRPGEEWIEPVTGMIFVHVPGGTFLMGYDCGDFSDEMPVHEVDLDGFFIGKYPVTQGQWTEVMNDNPSQSQRGDDYPVERVSWQDAKEFIRKLNSMNLAEHEFELPTEARWEYAARSGGKIERYAGSDDIDDVAWYESNSGLSIHPVGRKKPNGLGICDMSGNVNEWCEDVYRDKTYRKQQRKNPIFIGSGYSRVLRGGSCSRDERCCRSTYRHSASPAYRYDHVGFRLVISV